MVKVQGFTNQEEQVIRGLMARFGDANHSLCELRTVVKADIPGYNGKVMPRRVGVDGLEMDILLASCSPFTVAHELAHVSDITVRRQETFDNLSLEMSTGWHLAHRMSSEYYANRIACVHAEESHIFEAFQSDSTGLKAAALEKDWASFLIYYSLLLGIMHGMDRMDVEPLKLLRATLVLPEAVMTGIDGFRDQSVEFFDNYGDTLSPVCAVR